METTNTVRDAPAVKSAERALRILEILATDGPVHFTDIRRALEIPKSSLHALLSTMVAIGWLRPAGSGEYTVGFRASAIGISGAGAPDLIALAQQPLRALRDRVGETAHLARLDARDVVYLASEFSDHALNVRFEVGRRVPAYRTALGKAVLAELPDAELADHVPSVLTPSTPRTVRTRSALRAELRLARENGFAEEDEQNSLGVHCFAVAVRHQDAPLVALSCSIPTARLQTHRPEEIVAALVDARDQLLARLAPPTTDTRPTAQVTR